MQTSDDILSLLEEKGAQVAKEAQRAVILQPGALGDSILTLPLAKFMKEALDLGGVDIVGHADYVGFLPGRSCVDSVRSIETTELYRLFEEPATFDLIDHDPLIDTFSEYAWIVTFMGEANGNFEQNLIFTANCSHSAEVITLSLKPPKEATQHIAEYYGRQFAQLSELPLADVAIPTDDTLIRLDQADREHGLELLFQAGVDVSKKLVVIHPGSGGKKKCWHLANFIQVAKAIRKQEMEVLFLLGPVEMEHFNASEMATIRTVAKCVAHLALNQVVGVLGCADAFLGNDSGVTHLAGAMGLRTTVIFGPTDPTLYKPIGPALTVVRDANDGFASRPNAELHKAVVESLIADDKRPASS